MPSQPSGGHTASAGVAVGIDDGAQDDKAKNATMTNRHRRLEQKEANMIKRAHELQIGDLIQGAIGLSPVVKTVMCEGYNWVEAQCEDGSIRRFGWFISVEVSPSKLKNGLPV